MNTHAGKNSENKSQAAAHSSLEKKKNNSSAVSLSQYQPGETSLQELANNSPQVKQLKVIQQMANNGARAYHAAASTSSQDAVQMAKSAEERSDKQQRVARAKNTIAAVAPNFDADMAGHLFDGAPADGGDVDEDEPGGLHCYKNGALPGGINSRHVSGSKNGIHTINWDWNGSNPKNSTMFPSWLSEENAKTLIGLRYPDLVNGGLPDPAYPEATRTYITRGMAIAFSKHGDTVYPD
jgi:hypothetical protein